MVILLLRNQLRIWYSDLIKTNEFAQIIYTIKDIRGRWRIVMEPKVEEERKVGHVEVHDTGVYIANSLFNYKIDGNNWKKSAHSENQTVNHTYKMDPGSAPFHVPNGARIIYEFTVVAGYGKKAMEEFTYEQGNPNTASYAISGTSLKSKIHFNGVRKEVTIPV